MFGLSSEESSLAELSWRYTAPLKQADAGVVLPSRILLLGVLIISNATEPPSHHVHASESLTPWSFANTVNPTSPTHPIILRIIQFSIAKFWIFMAEQTAIAFGDQNLGFQVGLNYGAINNELHLPQGKPCESPVIKYAKTF